MKVLSIVVITIATCGSVHGQMSDEGRRCLETAPTQAAMNICGGEELKRSEAEVEDVYRRLLSAARNTPGAVAKLEATRRAWVIYRDAVLDAEYPLEDKREYGSIFQSEFPYSKAVLTWSFARELMELLKYYTCLGYRPC